MRCQGRQSQLGMLRRGDWRGIALMAVGLATFQTVLDDGNVYDWFGSPFIVKLSLLAAGALGAFIVLEFVTPEPLVNLRLLGRRNFGLGTLGTFSSASPSTARPICFRNTCWPRKVSIRSRSVRWWPGRGCRNCWSSRCCRC